MHIHLTYKKKKDEFKVIELNLKSGKECNTGVFYIIGGNYDISKHLV